MCAYFSTVLSFYSYSYTKTNIDNTRIMHAPHGVSHMITQLWCFGFSPTLQQLSDNKNNTKIPTDIDMFRAAACRCTGNVLPHGTHSTQVD